MRKSDAYTLWLNDAGFLAKSQRPKRIEGSYQLSIYATRPDKRRRDVDNLIKATSDLLVSIGVISDDSMAEKVSAEWERGEPGIRVVVESVGE